MIYDKNILAATRVRGKLDSIDRYLRENKRDNEACELSQAFRAIMSNTELMAKITLKKLYNGLSILEKQLEGSSPVEFNENEALSFETLHRNELGKELRAYYRAVNASKIESIGLLGIY